MLKLFSFENKVALVEKRFLGITCVGCRRWAFGDNTGMALSEVWVFK